MCPQALSCAHSVQCRAPSHPSNLVARWLFQITLDKLREGLARQARLADGEVEQMLRDTDVDGNGVIDYEARRDMQGEACIGAWQGAALLLRTSACTATDFLLARLHRYALLLFRSHKQCPWSATRFCPQEFVASTVHLSLLEREEICIKAFQQLDKVGGGSLVVCR